MISIPKQELMQWKVTFTENRLEYTEKKEQTAMAIVYSTLQNHIFSNTKNVIDQNRNRHSQSVKLKTYREYHLIETKSIIYVSMIAQILPSATQDIRRNVCKII